MSFENGVYLITSKATGESVGRSPIEELSLEPKRLFVLNESERAELPKVYTATTHLHLTPSLPVLTTLLLQQKKVDD
jgi:hypothetical protein